MNEYSKYGPFALAQAMAHLLRCAEEGPLTPDQTQRLIAIQRETNTRADLARLVARPALEAARA